MKRRAAAITLGIATAFGAIAAVRAASPSGVPTSGKVDFVRDVQPILVNNCYRCHGPTAQKGHLRLDQRDSTLKRDEPVVLVHKAGESDLIRRVSGADADDLMPPAGKGDRLTDAQVALLKRWVDEGATWPDSAAQGPDPRKEHWAFKAPIRPAVPAVKDAKFVHNPIDAFIAARLEKEGLEPSAEADRPTLIRRASLDLTGLPPTPAEVDAFVADPSPNAYENLVDRLMASPAYGERWAQVWLDLARYADSKGYAEDNPRSAWKYRDWVIAAINENERFDRFTIEQFAGDLLPSPSESQIIATAFHRNTLTNDEGGTDDEEFRTAAVVDRVNTTFQVYMGLTMGCAECHDHKFDPITQQEYFGAFAIFNQTQDADRRDDSPTLPIPTPEYEAQVKKLDGQIAAAQAALEKARKASPTTKPTTQPSPAVAAATKKLDDLKKARAKVQPEQLPIMRELPADKRRVTKLFYRGNFLDKGPEVHEGVPAFLPPLPKDETPNRLALAKWLVSPQNPLTARVTVNRYWEQLFGTGIVETSEDFGVRCAPPSHPELLDWLATELVRNGWDTKAIVRLIVTSATYRQSSKATPALLERDPYNRLLARGPRVRASAEQVRDQALFVSGLLSRKMFGEPARPPQPKLGLKAAFGRTTDWEDSKGEDRYRRAIYTSWRRSQPYPSMLTFDAQDRNVCVVRRTRTNTPLQALTTMNDPVYVEASQALGRRMMREGGDTTEARVAYGLRLCLGREPAKDDVRRLVSLYEKAQAKYAADPAAAKRMATEPIGPVPQGAAEADVAAWSVVGNVMLNLDEMFLKR